MAKRTSNNNSYHHKKMKLDNSDLWGDDPNIDDVDDCLALASQVYEQETLLCTQKNNVSILPSYNMFKFPTTNMFTSTQNKSDCNSDSTKPSSSKSTFKFSTRKITNHYPSILRHEDDDDKIKLLQERCEAKEGEVSILRNQFRAYKETTENDHKKQQEIWMEKIGQLTKKNDSINTELSFKNLEIANLQQKVADVSKYVNLSTLNISHIKVYEEQPIENRNKHVPAKNLSEAALHKLQVINENFYPLQNICRDKFLLSGAKGIKETNKNVDDSSLFNHVSIIMKCSNEELRSDSINQHIDRVVYISLGKLSLILSNLQWNTNVTSMKCNCDLSGVIVDASNFDKFIFIPNTWCEHETEVNVRQTLAYISEMLPYNYCLQQQLLTNSTNSHFALIMPIIKAARKNGVSHNFSGFYCSVLVLLEKSCQHLKQISADLLIAVVKEIVLSKPHYVVVCQIAKLFKTACLRENVVDKLCSNQNKDTCLLHILCSLFTKTMAKMNDCVLSLDFRLNIVKMTGNMMTFNFSWQHFCKEKQCHCLTKVTKLFVLVTHKNIVQFARDVKSSSFLNETNKQLTEIIRYSVQMLSVFYFKWYDIIVKCISINAQFTSVLKMFLDLKDYLHLPEEDLTTLQYLINVGESPIAVKSEKFANLKL